MKSRVIQDDSDKRPTDGQATDGHRRRRLDRRSTAGHRTARPTPVVSAHDLTRQYGEDETAVHALRGVSVDVASGALTAVMGPSGSGKSTLMHILAGLDRPTAGDVRIADIEIGELNDTQLTKLRREHIGFIFQFFNLLPMLTAKENIVLPLSIAGEKPDAGLGRRADDGRRPERAPVAPAVAALRRTAAAGRHRARAGLQADGHVRRRADRATSTRRPAARSWSSCAPRSRATARRP